MIKTVLSRAMKLKIKSEINPDERLIWSGQPLASKMAKRGIPLAVFGIPWTAFSLFWTYAASGFEMPSFNSGFDFFPLFGIPFILIGIGLLTAPFWMGFSAGNTVYVLTNKRAIIFSKSFSNFTIKDYLPEQLKDVYRQEDAEDRGSIIFGEEVGTGKNSNTSTSYGFLGIPDVREVEKLVKELAEKS